eukprot:7802453-Pyramimonas_sp.AAC.1
MDMLHLLGCGIKYRLKSNVLSKPSSFQCASWLSDSAGESSGEPAGEGGELDLSSLFSRVAELKSRQAEIPICVLDAMLPRQRLKFKTQDKGFRSLVGCLGPTHASLHVMMRTINSI